MENIKEIEHEGQTGFVDEKSYMRNKLKKTQKEKPRIPNDWRTVDSRLVVKGDLPLLGLKTGQRVPKGMKVPVPGETLRLGKGIFQIHDYITYSVLRIWRKESSRVKVGFCVGTKVEFMGLRWECVKAADPFFDMQCLGLVK